MFTTLIYRWHPPLLQNANTKALADLISFILLGTHIHYQNAAHLTF